MTMTRRHRWIPAATFFTALVALGVALARMFDTAVQHPRGGQAAQAVAALWCLSAIVWVWLVLSTTLSTLRRAVPALRGCTALDRATLPLVRTFFDRVAVASLTAVAIIPMISPPAHAQTAQLTTTSAAPYVRGTASETAKVPPRIRGSQRSTPSTPRTSAAKDPATPSESKPQSLQQPAADPTRPATPHAPGAQTNLGATHLVMAGESLWSIARDELHRRGESTSNPAIARYWGGLIRLNRNQLRSGNPNLIFVGETVVLPS